MLFDKIVMANIHVCSNILRDNILEENSSTEINASLNLDIFFQHSRYFIALINSVVLEYFQILNSLSNFYFG